MTLGERLKQVRGKVSQKDFGEMFGAAPNTVRKYENDEGPPNTDYIMAVCDKYNIHPLWILTGSGPMHKGQTVGVEEPYLEPRENQRTLQPQPCYVDENGQVTIPRWQNP